MRIRSVLIPTGESGTDSMWPEIPSHLSGTDEQDHVDFYPLRTP